MRRIRQIEFRTRRLVSDSFAGSYHSVFKGKGIAFDAVRPYEPGDDVRDIDWNVTARAGAPFVKRYVEERELTVMLVLDSSASVNFGTVNRQKRDLAAEMGAVLAYAAINNNDRVGLIIFSDQTELYIPPRKGRNHGLRLIRDLLAAKSSGKGTNLSLALRTINRILKQHAIVFLISDFLLSGQDYARDLLVTARRHDLVVIVLSDPREQAWPAAGLVGLRDAESGSVAWVDTTSPVWREEFKQRTERYRQSRDVAFTRAGIDRIDVPVDGNFVDALTRFFRQRTQRFAR
jgi:uncharacterized protein (DUF58 family)